jgi:multiple sugar transport system substrate-binding protein
MHDSMRARVRTSGLSRRRFLGLGAAGLAAAGLGVAGCSNFTSSSSGGGGGTEELVWTYWGTAAEKTSVAKAVTGFCSSKQLKPNVQNITFEQYNTKINTLIAANNPPTAGYLTEIAMRLGEEGKIVSVADQDGFDSFLPEALHYWAPDKAVSKTAIEIYTLYHHTEKTAAAGVTVPTTLDTAWKWDDFVTAADKLTKDKGGRSPSETGFDAGNVAQYGVLFGTDLQLLCGFLQSNNIELFDDAGTTCLIDSPESVEVIQRLSDLVFEHRVAPNATQTQSLGANPALQLDSGRVAMVIGGQWSLLDLAAAKSPFDVGMLPIFDKPATPILGGVNGVFAGSGLEAQASELLIWLASPDQVDLFSTGLWMPLQSKFYTDEKLLTSWTENDAHPASYRTAVIEPTLKSATSYPSFRLKNWTEISSVLGGGIAPLFAKKSDVPAALKALAPKVNKLMQGAYPGGK